ncbi:MAG: hypothetical protein KAU62_14675 [Candidatus Heimdallarchaeota archaeon]|nr:hypothetical protein [Candidatus Heimdallarchaeota archaeon]MCK4612396.1 hypothetical protein [Candidatus Heimdallarchaeota archaeon]
MLSFLAILSLIFDVLSFLGFDLYSMINLRWKKYYQIIWKKNKKLKPSEFFEDFRNFQEYYLETVKLKSIAEKIEKNQNILIIGQPLSGKTRLIFELVKKHLQKFRVLKPSYLNVINQNWKIPVNPFFIKNRILILDDLGFLIKLDSFSHLLQHTDKKQIPIIASCRSGNELEKIKNSLKHKGIYLEALFSEVNTYELKKIDISQAKEIADQLNIEWEDVNFDGTIGSLFMKLYEMEKRYSQLSNEEIKILQLIKKLYICGLFLGKLKFPYNWLLKLWNEESILTKTDFELLLRSLQKNDFVKISENYIEVEEVYLTEIIQLVFRKELIVHIEQMILLFQCIPEALATLGNFVHRISVHDLAIVDLLKQAMHANSTAVDIFTCMYSKLEVFLEKNKLKIHKIKHIKNNEKCLDEISEYAKKISRFSKKRLMEESYIMLYNLNISHSNLGIEYGMLADVENREDNANSARKHYNICLSFFTKSSFPFEYSATNHNLSNIYRMLGATRHEMDSFQQSLDSCKEALSYWTPEHFPIQFAETQISLGSTLNHIAEFNNDVKAVKESIQAFGLALDVLTIPENPLKYASAHQNLARSYLFLSKYENSIDNCYKGILSCDEAMKVYTIQKHPLHHARTQTTKGALFSKLAREVNKKTNAKESIKYLLIALTVLDLTNFPIEYAIAHLNLSSSYLQLSYIENKLENSMKTIDSCEEVLKVYTLEKYPFHHFDIKNNLGIAFVNLAEEEKNTEYSKKAISIFKEICKYHKEKGNLFGYSNGLMHKAIAYKILGVATNNVEYIEYAIELCIKSLRFLTKNKYPLQYGVVKINQCNIYLELAKNQEKEENCNKAREACLEALYIFTQDKYPEQHRNSKANLANIEKFCS